MQITGIPSKVHGFLDYTYAPLAFAAPRLLGFEDEEKAKMLCAAVGVGTLAYSLATDYELGAWRKLPYKSHAAIDVAAGVFNVAAPWLLGVQKNKRARNTLLVLGLTSVVVGILSLVNQRGAPKKLEVINKHWG